MLLSDFIKINPITMIVPSIKLESYNFGELLLQKLNNSSLSYDIPEENKNDIMIIVPTKGSTFNEIHHSSFINRNYEKFPKSIIFICGFDQLITIPKAFNYLRSLKYYKIPIIYSSILEQLVEINIKLLSDNYYQDSLIFNDKAIHVTNINLLSSTLKSALVDSRSQYNIFCYYHSYKDDWETLINYYNQVIDFYIKLMTSNGAVLSYDGKLTVN